jgi:signal transduction histidine kinase
MGLFMSYGIVREHQGRLLYEGGKRGGVFTMILPPAHLAGALRELRTQRA